MKETREGGADDEKSSGVYNYLSKAGTGQGPMDWLRAVVYM